ncbi:ABC transporter ATP-binding protein, partial [Devosia sp.]|uniref:ABC transporter ATP-binding protein n=1 Tax=Devosia sp. TaxID=1871048 RepID=UPI002AFF4549
ELRGTMRAELSALHARLATTMIYVTHDQVEAMTLADRIVVLRKGVIEQVDTPLNLYNRPQNLFVAGFIGAPNMNLFKVEAHQGRAKLPGGAEIGVNHEGAVTLGLRPQHLRLAQAGERAIEARVHLVEALGAETVVHATAEGAAQIITVLEGQPRIARGDDIRLAFDDGHVHVFDADGQRVD